MIKDITIGQYFPGNSFIHKLDPRTKILMTIAMLVLIFMCKTFLSLILMLLVVLAVLLISGVPLRMYLKNLKAIVPIILFTSLLNIFYVTDSSAQPLVDWNFIHIYEKGLWTALFIAVRILALIVSTSVMTYTTTPTMLTDGIERLLSPLNKLHIDIHTFAMMMTLALRFIPTLIEEIDRIMNAQKARGADLESGGLVKRAKALVPIIVPLIVSSVKRAYELAYAMECRCYNGGEGRTRLKVMKFGFRDLISVLYFAAGIAGVVLLNYFQPFGFGAVI